MPILAAIVSLAVMLVAYGALELEERHYRAKQRPMAIEPQRRLLHLCRHKTLV